VYDFSVNIQFSEGSFCVLGGFWGDFRLFGGEKWGMHTNLAAPL